MKISASIPKRAGKPSDPQAPAASFTIEAAVIVPFSLILICSAILLTFHLHDLAVIRAVSVTGVFGEWNGSAQASDIEEVVQEALSSRLITTDDPEVTVTEASGEYTIACGDISVNISGLSGRDTLLKYRVLKDGLLSVTGTEDN